MTKPGKNISGGMPPLIDKMNGTLKKILGTTFKNTRETRT